MTTDHQLQIDTLIRHIRAFKLMWAYNRITAAKQYLDEAHRCAWHLPKIPQKARIIASITSMQKTVDARYAAVQAVAADYEPSLEDLAKDYGEGRMSRRPVL